MTATDLETYEGQVTRLEQGYIDDLGRSINEALSVGGPFDLPVGTSYRPGNGTVYRLVFTPVEVIVQLDEPVPVGVRHGETGQRWVLLSKCNCTDSDFCHPFDLTPGREGPHWRYVQEKTGLGFADACAVTALLRAVCGTPL